MKNIGNLALENADCSNLYHFNYDRSHGPYDTAEEVLNGCAEQLRGIDFLRKPCGELVIIVKDDKGRWDMLNNPADWAADIIAEHAAELGKPGRVYHKRIREVYIYNLVLQFEHALILKAYAEPQNYKYLSLVVTHAEFNTQEFGLLLDLMIQHRMLKVAQYPRLRWLRGKYHID